MRTHLVRLTAEGEAALARWQAEQEEAAAAAAEYASESAAERRNEQWFEERGRWDYANMGGALLDSYRGW